MAKSNNPVEQKVFSLKHKEYITPNYIRITLSGDASCFENTTIGDNNKIFIPPAGVSEVHFPEYDKDQNQWIYPEKEVAPFVRTYTHRAISVAENELVIEFVNHGENGPASAWASNAKVGDKLGVGMRTEAKELYPQNLNWYLLVGDATAIPVLAAILETLPKSAKGTCIIEVPTKEDEQILKTNADIDFIWLHNQHPENGSQLAETVKKIKIPQTDKFGYVACEYTSVKEIRNYLRKDLGWMANELNAYSYWKAGVAEDKSVTDRQKEKQEIE